MDEDQIICAATGLVFSRDTVFISDDEPEVTSEGPWLMSISRVGESRAHSGALPYKDRLY